PIPRTLALILYGDLDISVIDEMPPGRIPVKTYSVGENMRERINGFVRKQVKEGRQIFIVCPLIEESEILEANSAVEMAERISKVDFAELKTGLLHGKMTSLEKEEIMKRFVKGDIDILVSTTVIEVGMDIPNASVMIIENAERYGLAQLHQLRGRVGRGAHQSFCILYNQSDSEISGERMKVMEKSADGFAISSKDLELRGPGEFFGTRQHGIPELTIANLYTDMDILKEAQEVSVKLIADKETGDGMENKRLLSYVAEKVKRNFEKLSL
ncbi:MAG: helicase-related protein, partial [Eubacteriales bacterium]|nr:helicase-related protein [Eubacteriales bacterium]